MDSTRLIQSHTWPFRGRINTENIVPYCRPHICQPPKRDNNGFCPSSSYPVATLLSPSPHVPGPLELPHLHQRPGECWQMDKSVCQLCKKVASFPSVLYSTGKGRQSLLVFTARCHGNSYFWYRISGLGSLALDWDSSLFKEEPLPLRCPSWCSATILGLGVSPLHVSAHPTILCDLFYISLVIGFLFS